jgi:DNA-binding IclR family transcriptional regulator
MTYVSYFPTTHMLSVSEGVGATRPMHCSALGKAYLSELEESALADILGQLDFVGGSSQSIRDADQLTANLAQVRRDGYALDLEETFEGVRCVAVPLKIHGLIVGAIGVTAPATRMSLARMRDLGTNLRTQLRNLYSPDSESTAP